MGFLLVILVAILTFRLSEERLGRGLQMPTTVRRSAKAILENVTNLETVTEREDSRKLQARESTYRRGLILFVV